MALTKQELFASIDDDQSEPGSSLISRGLYPSRVVRNHGSGPLGYLPIKHPNIKTYLHRIEEHNTKAAKEVVPIIIDMFKPNSVIDIGCGTGTWLKVFEENGIDNILGIDGAYVKKELIEIPLNKYIAVNLEQPLKQYEKFDLLLCLEVAEHLKIAREESFIKDLTLLSDNIIFSAALPNQGGQNHLNEQYPDFWIRIFNKYNYEAIDLIRPLIWNNDNVDWWYRQNILVFKKIDSDISISQKKINPIIAQELYESKLNEISSLQKELSLIKAGGEKFRYYLKAIFKRIIKRIK